MRILYLLPLLLALQSGMGGKGGIGGAGGIGGGTTVAGSPTPVSGQICQNSVSFAGTTVACALPSSVTASNSLALWVNTSQTIVSVICGSQTAVQYGAATTGLVPYFIHSATGGSTTCTLTFTSSSGVAEIIASEWTPGTQDTGAYNTYSNSANGTANQPISVTTAHNNETLFLYCQQGAGVYPTPGLTPIAMTQLGPNYSYGVEIVEYGTATTAGSNAPTCANMGGFNVVNIVAMGFY